MADAPSFLGARPGAKRVVRTGIALVHENEIIYPAAGSAAEAIEVLDDARARIEVYFPVEIEIREAGSAAGAPVEMPDEALARLARAVGQA